MKRTSRPTSTALPTTVAAVLLLAGCAGQPTSPPAGETSQTGAADASAPGPRAQALERSARDEASSPVNPVRDLGPPPGLQARQVEPLDTQNGNSTQAAPLEPTLQRLAQGDLVEPDKIPPATPELGARIAALRLYASGRAKLLAGEVGQAVLDLESATRLDPTAAEPWRELGEAQLLQNKRLSAMSSFRQSVRRGLREPRTLWLLGRDAQRAGRSTEAVRLLAAARDASPESADPVLGFLVNAELSDALVALQCYGAAAEALDAAMDFPDQFGAGTRLRLEFAELLRRRGDLQRDLGDLWCRLGRYDRAADAYAQATLSPSLDPSAVIPRLVHVSLKRGRPSEASLTILEHIRRSGGLPDERTIAVIRFLADRTQTGPALAGALEELRTARGNSITPSVSSALTRAQAAAVGRSKAVDLLRSLLAEQPDDGAALGDLLARVGTADAAALTDELVALARRAPQALERSADSLLAAGGSADPVLARLATKSDDAAVALRATLLGKLGLERDGAALVVNRAWKPPFDAPGLAVEAVLAAGAGRYEEAKKAYSRLGATPGVDIRSLTRAALALQRSEEALVRLRGALEGSVVPDVKRVDMLVIAAGVCATLGKAEEAEGYLKRAAAADPRDDRPYVGLLRFYAPGGPLADQSKLTEVIRALRDAAPASRSLRFAAAQELAERRLDSQAEQLLLGLLDDSLADANAGLLLTSLWDRRGVATAPGSPARATDAESLSRAESWLRSRTQTHPEVPWLWTSLARIVWAKGDAPGAEQLLADRLVTRPIDEFAHMRETILREGLSRRDDADAAALARLKPEPRTIGASIELVDLLARTDRRAEALEELRHSVPGDVTLTDDQQATLGMMLARIAAKYQDKPLLADNSVAGLLEEVAARGVRLPPQLHEFRIAVLATRVTDDAAAVRRATEDAATQHPSLAASFYARAATVYLQADKTARALPFLQLCVKSAQNPSADLLAQLARATWIAGERTDLDWILANLDTPARLEPLLRRFSNDETEALPTEPDKLRALLAYRLAGQFSLLGRTELAHDAFRRSIALDPNRAITLNDFGYGLLEEGGDLNEAASLIDRAHKLSPDDASITDSLAWVRYHQGFFTDQPGPPPIEGAVSLLKKAAATPKGAKDATILGHLGDALWLSGQKDEAIEAWTRSESVGAEDLSEARRQSGSKEFLSRLTRELEATRAKLKAARENTEPPLPPRRGAAPGGVGAAR